MLKENIAENYNIFIWQINSLDLAYVKTLIKEIQNDNKLIFLNVNSIIENKLLVRLTKLLEKLDRDEGYFIFDNFLGLANSLKSEEKELILQKIVDLFFKLESTVNDCLDRSQFKKKLIFIEYQDFTLPRYIREMIPIYRQRLPNISEIQALLAQFSFPQEEIFYKLCSGLGYTELFQGLKLASRDPERQKIEQQLIDYRQKRLSLLSLDYLPQPQLNEIGGLDLYQKFILDVAEGYSTNARAMGLPKPKGVLMVGPPGTGKTHAAKVTAQKLGYPLINVAIDRVLSRGAEFFKNLLLRLESLAPCVVYFDELDKFFESVNSQEILAVLLTWLQEKTSTTFVIATLNRLEKLPPELTRAGRFDEIFYVDFPQPGERMIIIKSYAKLYDPRFNTQDLYDFYPLDRLSWGEIISRTHSFTGSELKQLVDKTVMRKWQEMGSLEKCEFLLIKEDFIITLKDMKSLFQRNPKGILRIKNQAQAYTRPSSSEDISIFKNSDRNIFTMSKNYE